MTTPDPNSRHPLGPGSHAPLEDAREMPECYPIKGNIKDDGERLYHRPDSENYGATIAEVWFEGPSAAEAAGFVLAPTHPDDSSSDAFEPGGASHPCTAEQVQAFRSSSEHGDVADSPESGGGVLNAGKAAAGAAGAAVAGGAAALFGKGDDAKAASDKVGDAASATGEAASAAAGAASDKVQDAASATGNAASATAGAAGEAASGTAGAASDKVQDAASATGNAASATAGAAGEAASTTGDAASATGDAASATAGAASAAAASTAGATGSGGTDLVYEGDADFERIHPYGWGSHAPLVDPMEMPWCYPIKGNAGSGKYHRPDSIGYPDTVAEVWFDSPSSAEAAGFVAAGSHPEGSNSTDFEPGGPQHPCSAADIATIRSGQADTAGKSGFGTGAKVGAAGAAAGLVGAAALAGRGDDDDADIAAKATETSQKVTAETEKSAKATSETTKSAKASGTPGKADGKVSKAEAEDTSSGKKLAAGAAGAAAAGAAGLAAKGALDKDKPDTSAAAKTTAGKATTTGKAAATGKAATTGKAAATGKADGTTKAKAAATGAEATAGRKGGRAWWLWLLPLLLLGLLLFFLLRGCDGDDGGSNAAVVADPTETPVPDDDGGDAEAAAAGAVAAAGDDDEEDSAAEEESAEAEEVAEEETEAEPTPEPEADAEEAEAADEAASSALAENCPTLATDMTDAGYGGAANLLATSGLMTTMADSEAITIFAPQDAVLEAPEVVELASNASTLASLLAYHVVDGQVASTDLKPGAVATTSGENAIVTKATNGLRYGGTGIVEADVASGGCMVHGIDGIAVPASLSGALGLASLNDGISRPAIAFEGDTADLTDADKENLEALCAYIGTTDPSVLAPVSYRNSEDADIDAARQKAVHEALAACGGEGITLVAGSSDGASFTG